MAESLTPAPTTTRRWTSRVALIVAVVLLLHVWLAQRIAANLEDFDLERAMPARMEVAYVREMKLSTPPPTAAAAAPDAPSPVVEQGQAASAPRPSAAASAAAAAKEAKAKAAKAARVARLASAASAVAAAEAARADANTLADAASVSNAGAAAASGAEEAGAAKAGAEITLPATTAESTAAVAAASAPVASFAAGSAASAPGPLAAASAPAATASAAQALAAAAPGSGASGAAAFEWPSSTRMTYILTGQYRGPVNGTAQVEWIRDGRRYQVHLDLLVGPSFAPIITRQMSSEGLITAAGLAPQRYDQETKVVLRDRQHSTIRFEPEGITLANGDKRINSPGMQDTASQFVQLTYVFSTRPDLLRVGGTVDIPLALPHKVDIWTYDVVEEETLNTNFGPLPTIHLKPRRTGPPRVGELSAEIWFAPQLRYLPVRIKIAQDADNFLDLLIEKPPEIAAS